MFGWIKNAARAAVGFTKSAGSAVARGAVKSWGWLRRRAAPALRAVPVGIRYLFRGVSWGWMSVIEVYSVAETPFLWGFLNITYGVLRGAENVWNWATRNHSVLLHRLFPVMDLATVNAANMVAFYPFVVFPAWLLSPITGKGWYLRLMAEYRTRVLHLADDLHVDRFRRDMRFWAKPVRVAATAAATPPPEPWSGVFTTEVVADGPAAGYDGPYDPDKMPWDPRRTNTPMDLEEEQKWLSQRGLVKVSPQPGMDPRSHEAYDYLAPFRDEEVGEVAMRDIGGNRWEELKTGAPTSYEQLQEIPDSDPTEAVIGPEDIGESWKQVKDPKRRSYTYGLDWALAASEKIPDFLDSPEQQKKIKALLHQQVKRSTSGFTVKATMEGFDSVIAAHHDAQAQIKTEHDATVS